MSEHRLCGAKTRHSGPCKGWARKGQIRCRMHGGSIPRALRAAERRLAQAEVVAYLEKQEIQPIGDPIAALEKLAGEVVALKDALADRVASLKTDWRFESKLGTEQLRSEVALLERAMDRAGKLLVDMARLNLGERQVRLAEQQAALLTSVITHLLGSPELGLSDAQQEAGREVASRELRLLVAS